MAKIPVERKSSGLPWWAWLLIAIGIALLLWLLLSLFTNNTAEPTGVVDPVVAETATNVLVVAPEDQTIEPLENANMNANMDTNMNANVNAVEVPTVDTSVIVTVEVPAGDVPTVGTADLATAVVPTVDATLPTVDAAAPTAAPATGVGEPLTDVVAILAVPDKATLIDRAVQLDGIIVQRVTGDKTFFVGPSAEQEFLAVIADEEPSPTTPIEGEVDINAGQTVNLIGTIQQVPSIEEMQQRWNATPEEAAQLAEQQFYMRVQEATIVNQ